MFISSENVAITLQENGVWKIFYMLCATYSMCSVSTRRIKGCLDEGLSLCTHTNPHQHEAALWELSSWEEIAQKRSNCMLHAIKVVKNCGSRWLKYFSQYAFATQIPTLHALTFPSHGTLLHFFFWWCEENQFCALPKRSKGWQKITEKAVELLLGRIFSLVSLLLLLLPHLSI